MKKNYFCAFLCFAIFTTAFAGKNGDESKAKEPYSIKLNVLKSSDSDFTPSITPILGMSLRTSFNQAEGGSAYNFYPANVRVGLGGVKAQFSKTISAVGTFTYHTNGGICDLFMQYKPSNYFAVKVGRIRGTGVRSSHETGPFGVDLGDYPYFAAAMGAAHGTRDLRHLGVNIIGSYNWLKYGFFLHNHNSNRVGWMSSTNDGPGKNFNHGLEFKSWDLSLSFNPIRQLEFGGHIGSLNVPGMGKDTKFGYSAFCYWTEPGKYKLKFDFGHYEQVFFKKVKKEGAVEKIEYLVDYDPVDYAPRDRRYDPKTGFSLLAGYFINPQFELLARFEHADHKSIKGEVIQLYTAGVAYYIPGLPSRNKITLFYQHRKEKVKLLKNDILALQYQFVF